MCENVQNGNIKYWKSLENQEWLPGNLLERFSEIKYVDFWKYCVSSVAFAVVYIQILDEGQFSKQYQWQNRGVTEWASQQVARWLVGLNLEHHIPEFTAQNIDGERLLQLESQELKVHKELRAMAVG